MKPDDVSIVITLISVFGSIISFLLILIGWFIARYVKQNDVKHDGHVLADKELGEEIDVVKEKLTAVRVTTETNKTDIKNLHHRLKGFGS